MRIAIIGAGIAGMSCAHTLLERGADVEIFEKNAFAGGRIATSFVERDERTIYFDNGAQYFTVSSPEFREHVEKWLSEGAVALWKGKIGKIVDSELEPEENSHERYVGVPHMRVVAELMAKGLNISFDNEVKSVRRTGGKWILQLKAGVELGDFDGVVIGTPPPQAMPVVSGLYELKEQCASIVMNPCWSTMASFDSRLGLEFDGIFGDKSSALSWICRDSSKPGRPPGERFVLHATPAWTREHIADDAKKVSALLLQEFFEMTRTPLVESVLSQSHLWLNAAPAELKTFTGLADASGTLRICGDWCHSGKVEGAFLSGKKTAEGFAF